jgi:hypothetical protein
MAAGRTIVSLPAPRIDTEEDLVPRIQQEHNPVKRAKFEIRLARVKLLHASGACQKDDHDACTKLLDSYMELIRNSWKDLQSAGENSVKHPSGFRELDIALREDMRTFDDTKREMPLEDRGILDPLIGEVNKIHDAVFAALFPTPAPRPQNKTPVQPHFVVGGTL